MFNNLEEQGTFSRDWKLQSDKSFDDYFSILKFPKFKLRPHTNYICACQESSNFNQDFGFSARSIVHVIQNVHEAEK